MQAMRPRLDATRHHRYDVPSLQITQVGSTQDGAMKAMWRGSVVVTIENHGEIKWQGSVKAMNPTEATERAVRAALSGQPRRADAAFEVTVTLHKEDAHV